MTQDERIATLEREILGLKEELRKNKKPTVWKKVKENFRKEFDSFNWVDEWNFTNIDGKLITQKNDMNESYNISQAIGTLVRIASKRKGVNYLEESDFDRAIRMTQQILEIMQNERR